MGMEEFKTDFRQAEAAEASKTTVTVSIEPSSGNSIVDEKQGPNGYVSSLAEIPSPKVKKSPPLLVETPPSPKVSESLASLVETLSPTVKKSLTFQAKDSVITSPTETSTPKIDLAADSSTPEKNEVSISPASSPKSKEPFSDVLTETSSPSKKERKSSKRSKRSKDKDPNRKSSHTGERKRGQSTSSSDDPKASRSRTESGGSRTRTESGGSRSRTESGGSELLDVFECQAADQELSTICTEESCAVESVVQAPISMVVLEGHPIGHECGDSKESGEPLSNTEPVTSGTKKRRKESLSGKKRRHSSKRSRHSSSSSDDPKSSRSHTESLSSEITGCQALSGQHDAEVIDSTESKSAAEVVVLSRIGREDSCPPVAGNVEPSNGSQYQIYVSNYDNDFSEC